MSENISKLERNTTIGLLATMVALGSFNWYKLSQLLQSSEQKSVRIDNRLPKIESNQTLILHPDYLSGQASLGYTLLTDTYRNGDWDVAERVHGGFTTGDFSRKFYFKNGFGPSQAVDVPVEIVEPDFFKSYQ